MRKKFSEWRGETRNSLVDYAGYIGVSHQVMANWYNGKLKKRPSPEMYSRLIEKYGNDVYDVLGLPRPQSDEDLLAEFPAEWRERFLRARREYTAELAKQGITTDTPEAEQIITDALTRHGINFTLTHGSD